MIDFVSCDFAGASLDKYHYENIEIDRFSEKFRIW